MSTENDSQPLPPASLWIFWSAVLISLCVFLLVSSALHLTDDRGYEPAFIQRIVVLFTCVALATIPFIFFLRRLLYFRRRARDAFRSPSHRSSLYFTMSLLSWSLCEFVAVLGLVLALMTYDVRFYLPFMATTLVLLLLFRPKRRDRETSPG